MYLKMKLKSLQDAQRQTVMDQEILKLEKKPIPRKRIAL